eukprot:CAMPEP_0178891594 /NCGR_PEP_ID=MMETSP0747-20121128/19031_1 /TAXON_ID=913974 /ORGANISM="Nitzschia punctata, Strain CCMP561" /LENGTH=249 /DNA_ID=CAMNT_0020561467 /DNA_START=129 /DNA_END=878 /DNA_ORIENTATION=+
MTGESWKDVSQSAKLFVESLLQYDPNDRPTASEAYNSKWIQSSRNVSTFSLFQTTTSLSSAKEIEKSIHELTEFRRKAWGATQFSHDEIMHLQNRLEGQDESGQGLVSVKQLIRTIQEVSGSVVTNEFLLSLKGEESFIKDEQHQMEYIDFMIEVKRGRKRNAMDKLVETLDKLDIDNSRQVPIDALLTLLDDDQKCPIPAEFQEEFRQILVHLKDFYGASGTLSTLHVLHWFEKRMAKQQRDSVQHQE